MQKKSEVLCILSEWKVGIICFLGVIVIHAWLLTFSSFFASFEIILRKNYKFLFLAVLLVYFWGKRNKNKYNKQWIKYLPSKWISWFACLSSVKTFPLIQLQMKFYIVLTKIIIQALFSALNPCFSYLCTWLKCNLISFHSSLCR